MNSDFAAFTKVFTVNKEISVWIEFGTGENIGEHKSRVLPMFHALTGCDTSSSFLEKGKKSAWNAWSAYPEFTDPFIHFTEHQKEIDIPSD